MSDEEKKVRPMNPTGKAYWASPEGKAELKEMERAIEDGRLAISRSVTRHTREALIKIRDILRRAGWNRADDSGD